MTMFVAIIAACQNPEIAREKARKEFYKQYYKYINQGKNPRDEKALEIFRKAMIEYPYALDRVIRQPERDKAAQVRQEYLQTQKHLPKFIRRAIQSRKLVMAMTEHEFFITVGDTAHLQRKIWHDSNGNSIATYYEKRINGVPYGRGVKFVNGYLAGFSVID